VGWFGCRECPSLLEQPRLSPSNIRAQLYANNFIKYSSFHDRRGLDVQISFPQTAPRPTPVEIGRKAEVAGGVQTTRRRYTPLHVVGSTEERSHCYSSPFLTSRLIQKVLTGSVSPTTWGLSQQDLKLRASTTWS
jgi:hypothetical protein